MNEHTLPDDLSLWPGNPFDLLGVAPGVSERDLRRAYARLIRTYKPEQSPEHFRRIREAYEAVRDLAPFFATLEAPVDSPDLPAESPPAGQSAPPAPEADHPSEPVSERLQRPSLPPSFEEELDEAWNWAVEGDEARAYARLLDLQLRYPSRSETCLRLHCLLSIAPELDPRRAPCDFLVQGLRLTGGSGPCHELYDREITDNPGEALTERFAGLMNTTTQPGLLATFVRWRWSAAGRQKRFEVIAHDLAGLRARLAVEQDEIWLRLLSFAADQLAWASPATGNAPLSECLLEIARLAHLQLRCADIFDRLESLEHIAAGWHTLMQKGTVPADFLELLSRFWTRPFAEIRRSVMALLAAVSTENNVWLAYLDRVRQVSPHVLSLFDRMLDSYQWTLDPDEDDRDPEELTVLARHFLQEHGGLGYSTLRPRLLAFCLRERIDPEVVAQPALSQIVVLPEARLQQLVNDRPLRHVYRACILFRT
jgi:hypothetical protein